MYCDTALSIISLLGIDTGNVRMGMSGRTSTFDTSDYFVRLSHESGQPCIPIFNSANKSSTYVSVLDVGASTTSNVTLVLAECGMNTGL
jgi:hypothetical protein